MLKRLLLVLAVLCSASCSFDPELDPQSRIRCGPAPEQLCPRGWECFEATGFCVPEGNADLPTLRLKSATPEIVRAGVSVKLEVSSSTPLGKAPRLTFQHSLGVLTPELTGEGGPDFVLSTYTLPSADDLGEGLVTVFGDGTSQTGATINGSRLGTFTVDRTPPEILQDDSSVAPGIVSPLTRTLVFARIRMSEPVKPSVRLRARDGADTRIDSLAAESNENGILTFKISVPIDAPNGVWSFALTGVEDLAGNAVATELKLGTMLNVNELLVDRTPPVVSPLGIQGKTYSTVSGFNIIQVPVTSDDPDAIVQVCVGASPCVTATSGSTVPLLVSPLDGEGPQIVLVRAVDAAGNEGRKTETVIYDFTAPSIVGTIGNELQPPTNCPLTEVVNVAQGAKHRVYFTVSEQLLAAPTVTSGALGYTLTSATGTAPGINFSFELVPSTTAQNQTADTVVELTDRVGNRSTPVLRAGLVIDIDAPPPLGALEQAKLLYERNPWGSRDTNGLPRFAVTVANGALNPLESLVFYESASVTSPILGHASADSAGVTPTTEFTLVDRSRVWARRFDAACNAATAMPQSIQNAVWVATGGTGPGSAPNPHVMYEREGGTAMIDESNRPIAAPFLSSPGSATPVRSATGRWENVLPGPLPAGLTQRANMSAAFDTRRGRLLMFGGDTVITGTLNETWVLEDQQWSRVTVALPPSARNGVPMVYDPDNDRFVLFGGAPPTPECWVFTWADGWSQIQVPNNMQYTVAHSMVYDPDHRRIVMFGGLDGISTRVNTTWSLKGTAWTQITNGGRPMPVGRSNANLAWDGKRHRLILFGGSSNGGPPGATPEDTWQLVDETWSLVPTPVHPPFRSSAAMIYDPVRQRLVLHGGVGASNESRDDTWQLDDSGWSEIVSSLKPVGRQSHQIVFNTADNSIVMLGGAGTGLTWADSWQLKNDQWLEVTDRLMSDRRGHAMVWDPIRNRAIVFGGRSSQGGWLGDTWFFRGSSWVPMVPATTTTARSAAQSFFDPVQGRTLLIGGVVDGGTTLETAQFRDTQWQRITTPPQLTARSGMASAIDSQGRVLLTNGATSAGPVSDNWLLSANGWAQVASNPPAMPARSAHTMQFDPIRNRFVVFGGSDGGSALSDTWVLQADGGWAEPALTFVGPPTTVLGRAGALSTISNAGRMTVWGGSGLGYVNRLDNTVWTFLSNGFAGPGTRSGTNMVYDSARDRTMFFAGGYLGARNDIFYLADTGGFSDGPSAPADLFPRAYQSMQYDPTRDRMVMYGGRTALAQNSQPLGDSWEFKNERWARINVPPTMTPRIAPAMVYDSLRKQFVMFGGLDQLNRPLGDTWVLRGTSNRGPAVEVAFSVRDVVPTGATLQSLVPLFRSSGYSAITTEKLPDGATLLPDGGALWPDGGSVSNPSGGTFFATSALVYGTRLETWDPTNGQLLNLASHTVSTRSIDGTPVLGADGGAIADAVLDLTTSIENAPDGGVNELLTRLANGGVMQFQVTTRGGSNASQSPATTAELAVDYAELRVRYQVP